MADLLDRGALIHTGFNLDAMGDFFIIAGNDVSQSTAWDLHTPGTFLTC